MEMGCDLVVDCINRSLPFERKWEEKVEKHLEVCRECQELMHLISELPSLINAGVFSAQMKERILTTVFEEKSASISEEKPFHGKIAWLPFLSIPSVTLLLRKLIKGSNWVLGKETIKD